MGLQTGAELARTSEAIVDPNNLTIIAYRISGSHLDHDPSYLRVLDIREIGKLGIIINDSDEFVEPDDIIVNKSLYDDDYKLEGKHVVDDQKTKIGKVIDYVIDIDSFVVEQLVVRRPLLKSLKDDELLIRRSQIIKVTDDTIIVKSGRVKHKAVAKPSKHYVNPFRNASPQPETIRIDNGH